jgi:hypothetical protein
MLIMVMDQTLLAGRRGQIIGGRADHIIGNLWYIFYGSSTIEDFLVIFIL